MEVDSFFRFAAENKFDRHKIGMVINCIIFKKGIKNLEFATLLFTQRQTTTIIDLLL